jgi:hypothetical protein
MLLIDHGCALLLLLLLVIMKIAIDGGDRGAIMKSSAGALAGSSLRVRAGSR